jgi:hypothetical protein
MKGVRRWHTRIMLLMSRHLVQVDLAFSLILRHRRASNVVIFRFIQAVFVLDERVNIIWCISCSYRTLNKNVIERWIDLRSISVRRLLMWLCHCWLEFNGFKAMTLVMLRDEMKTSIIISNKIKREDNQIEMNDKRTQDKMCVIHTICSKLQKRIRFLRSS